jgi:hypothetical protein
VELYLVEQHIPLCVQLISLNVESKLIQLSTRVLEMGSKQFIEPKGLKDLQLDGSLLSSDTHAKA